MAYQSPAVWLHEQEVLQCRENTALQDVDAAFHQFHGELSFLNQEWQTLHATLSTVQSHVQQAFQQCRVRPQQMFPLLHRQVLDHLHALEQEERSADLGSVPPPLLAVTTTNLSIPQQQQQQRGVQGAAKVSAAPVRHLQQSASTAADRYRQFVDRHGGATLGWADEDHTEFVRVLLRQLEPRLMLETLVEALPQCSRQEIARHIELYAELGQLEHEKRIEMEAYRQQRHADAANERVMSELRREAVVEQTKTEEEKAEAKRRMHHAALRKKLEEWRAAKANAVVEPRLNTETKPPQAAPSQRAPLRGRPLAASTAKPLPPSEEPVIATPTAAATRGTSKVSLERRRMQDEEWLRRRQELVSSRSLSAVMEKKEERILRAATKLAPSIGADLRRATGATQSTRLRSASSSQEQSTTRPLTSRGSSAHSFQRAPASWCDRNHLR